MVVLSSHGGAGSCGGGADDGMMLTAAADEDTSSITRGREKEKWKGKVGLLGLLNLNMHGSLAT